MKLGRVRFSVKEIRGEVNESESSDITDTSCEEVQNPELSMDCESNLCRICMSLENEKDNPMISPCHCSGTMKYIHLFCLQRWIGTRLLKSVTDSSISYVWKSIDCEICQKAYPSDVPHLGKPFDLYPIEKPEVPYIMLEEISKARNTRGVHIIHMRSKSTVKLGRGHESDVRVSDISVSRCHAQIRYCDSKFYLEDINSKFGTLVEISKPYCLEINAPIAVQAGRTVLSFVMKAQNPDDMMCLDEILDP